MLLTAGTVVIGLAGPLTVAEAKTTHARAHKKHHKKKHHKAKPAGAAVLPAAAALPAACTGTPADPGIINGAVDPFIQHIDSAHLETSPVDQVKALVLTPDEYVKIHTILVESMLAPTLTSVDKLSGVLEGVLAPLMQHIDSAHLETSPGDQIKALVTDPNGYTLLHTILAEHAAQPLLDWVTSLMGTAGITCAAPAPAAAGSMAMPMPAAAGPKSLKIENFMFSPAMITVPVGTAVTWTNHDSTAHTVTSTGGGPLKSSNITPEGKYSYTFSTPGTFSYVCAIHPNMKGTITVQ